MMRTLVLVLLLCACHKAQSVEVPKGEAHAVVLMPTETLGKSFVAQQRLEGTYGERSFTLDAALQLREGKLTLMGLTPFNTRAFVLEQTGTDVHLEKFIERELPFDPRYVLDDVHRVFFRGLNDSGAKEEFGERIIETRANGKARTRVYERLDGKPAGKLIVTFEGDPAPVIAPVVTIQNGWYGYTLRITTVSQSYLD